MHFKTWAGFEVRVFQIWACFRPISGQTLFKVWPFLRSSSCLVRSSFLEDKPGRVRMSSKINLSNSKLFNVHFCYFCNIWVWSNTIYRNMNAEESEWEFSLMISLPTNAATKHTLTHNTSHMKHVFTAFGLQNFWLGFLLMFVSLLKIIFFFWEKKRFLILASSLSPSNKKASAAEVFIMCAFKKIGFIIG